MKKLRWLILVSLLLVLLSACAAPPEDTADVEEQVVIGYTLPTLQFPFYVRMHDTFIEEAEARGWEVVYVDGNLDSLTQVNAALDLITDDVDALVMATWWPEALIDVFDNAEASNIPVFLMDLLTVPEGVTFASTAGTDNYDAGFVGGAWMAERLQAEGRNEVNLVTISMNSDVALARVTGFIDGMAENGINVNHLNEFLGDTRANAMASTEDALVTFPQGEIDLIFGYSAQSSLGAFDAAIAANRTEIQIVGFDGEDDEIELIDQGTQYIGTIVQFPDEMAILTAELVERVLNGETIPQVNPVPAGVYDGN